MNQLKTIKVIMTGGTICSLPDENTGKSYSNASKTVTKLEENYKSSTSPFKDEVYFDYVKLNPDILSENMTVSAWNDLLDIFKKRKEWGKVAGVIVLHGTDTLAYTSALLSVALSGIDIPVIMVSAQRSLDKKDTNGYVNFRSAVELIMNGIKPNVYVSYCNVISEKGKLDRLDKLYVHYGIELTQCPNYSDNFHSENEMLVDDISNANLKGKAFETAHLLVYKIERLNNDVLFLQPYTNLCYDNINIDGLNAIVHATYHSQSVCIGRPKIKDNDENKSYSLEEIKDEDKPFSILSLLQKCHEKKVTVLLSPCNESNFTYGTTANALDKGGLAIYGTTQEVAYVKTLIGCALGKRGKQLQEFLAKSVNYEFIYK